jgi:carbon monoxide dehydrogenase subunit G
MAISPVVVERTVSIHRPVGRVFALVADFTQEPRFNPAIASLVKTSDGPIGVGTTWEETLRIVGGGHGRTVTEFDTDRQVSYRNDGRPFPVTISYTFEPAGSGTRLTARAAIRLPGSLAPLAPLVRGLLGPAVALILRNIKKVLEASP